MAGLPIGHPSLGSHLTRKAPVIGSLFFRQNSNFPPVSRGCTFLMAPYCTLVSHARKDLSPLECMAGTTGLEPATSAVTGQRSDQLSYVPTIVFNNLDICHIESSVSQLSLFSLDSTFSLLWTQFWAFWTPSGHQMDTKTTTATTKLSLPDEARLLVSVRPLTEHKNAPELPADHSSRRSSYY